MNERKLEDILKDQERLQKEIQNRGEFSYDVNADALYQQFKDKHAKQGKMAAQDATGIASSLTGGFGNSYAATVGNQAYQGEIQKANDIIPELYQLALDKYTREGEDLYKRYNLLQNEENVHRTVSAGQSAAFDYMQQTVDRLKGENEDYYAKWKNAEVYNRYVKAMTDAGYTQGEDGHWEKAPVQLTREQTKLLDEKAAVYASNGEKTLQSWLEYLVGQGLPKETAAEIMDEYFPIY